MTDVPEDRPAPVQAEIVEPENDPGEAEETPAISEPTKLIRIASMTKAMLEEVRQADLDEAGRMRLVEIHEQSLQELRQVLSPDLVEEFDDIFRPMNDDDLASESVIRIAQAQLIGWLEGLFHGIQATLFSQQMAAQAQLQEMQRRSLTPPRDQEQGKSPGLYL